MPCSVGRAARHLTCRNIQTQAHPLSYTRSGSLPVTGPAFPFRPLPAAAATVPLPPPPPPAVAAPLLPPLGIPRTNERAANVSRMQQRGKLLPSSG